MDLSTFDVNTPEEGEILEGRRKMPPGVLLVEFVEAKLDTQTMKRLNSPGEAEKLVMRITIRAVEPAEAAGCEDQLMEVLGSDEKPIPDQETLKQTMRRVKLIGQAAGVSVGKSSLKAIANDLAGKRAKVVVQHETDKKNPQFTRAKYVAWHPADYDLALEAKPVPPQGQAAGPVPMPPPGVTARPMVKAT